MPRTAPLGRLAETAWGDRVSFSFGGQAVEMTARLTGLGKAEEQRLLDAVSSLLEEHGLVLQSARINGRFALGSSRGSF